MQIQVNLLPGAKKAGKSARGASLSLGSAFKGLGSQIKDPWMLGAAGAVVLAVAAVGVLFTSQQASAGELAQRLDRAVRDSARLTTVLEARRKVSAERDSVERQVSIIRTIDDNRYVWAHLLDEISAALPSYTWLTTVEQTSTPSLPPGARAIETAPVGKGKAAAKAAQDSAAAQDSVVINQPIAFKVIGQTIDMQALTQFMKDLEGSPFVKLVRLVKSEIVVVDNKDVTQFEIQAEYEVPAKDALTTEPLVVPVR
ncbi:MAG TPA: PilN domain-containing protein [Gemmatimonadaceae bacterium]|nr:PilN domain-containing protein [Gemmatimonadaceae bacterium]